MAELYILDRYFHDSTGLFEDNLLKAIKYISDLDKESKILVLTSRPSKDLSLDEYPCIKEIIDKKNFNIEKFRESVSKYLEIDYKINAKSKT